MSVRLNITMDDALYRRLKRAARAEGISAFISAAVKAALPPGTKGLDAAYKAASRQRWRVGLSNGWATTEGEEWPD